jgi:hypothetical protein
MKAGDGYVFALEAEEEGRRMAAEVGFDYFEAAEGSGDWRLEIGYWRLETRDWRPAILRFGIGCWGSFGSSLARPFDGPFVPQGRLRVNSG